MSVEELFGGKTRFGALEALAETERAITANQIAIAKGLDPAATYRCLTQFSEFGIVESGINQRNQKSYKLSEGPGKAAVEFLRSLKQKTSESIDLEKWMSPEMQAKRMVKVARIDVNQLDASVFGKPVEKRGVKEIVSERVAGELSALISSSRIAFNELFEERNGTFILKT
ncbi:MAG: helix-turn-helix domain-containing protein [Nitrososphaera sp.]